MKTKLPISVSCSVLVMVFGCGTMVPDKPAWEGKKMIVLEKKLTIGTDNLAKGDYVFGDIWDITTDSKGNIYVADSGMYRVQKYRADGEFELSFGKGYGQGPGEFLRMTKIAIDENDHLYVSDIQQRRITVFDRNAAVVNTVKVKMMPFQPLVGPTGAIYTVGYPPSYKGPLIHEYDNRGSLVRSFCKRNGIHNLALRSGDMGNLAIDPHGNVLYTIVYPYEIRKYSPDGQMLMTISRTPSFYNPPVNVKIESFSVPAVKLPSGSNGLVVLPNNQLLHVYYELKSDQFVYYGDLYSLDGELLLTVPFEELGIHSFRIIWADRNGNLYFDESGTIPKVTKYSFTVVDLS